MMKSVVPENTCRLCLRVNTKLFRLSDIYKDFIENALLKKNQYIPQEDYTACNICLYLVSKSFDVIQRICNTQKIIYELLVDNNCEKLTVPILESINRDETGLTKFCTATLTIVDINGSCDEGYFCKKTEPGERNEKSEESNKLEISIDIKQENETQYNSEIINSFTEININQDENIEGLDGDKYLSDDREATDPMEIFAEAYTPSPTFGLENLSETRKNYELIITSSKVSHPGHCSCVEPARHFRPFPSLVINNCNSEEITVKDVEEEFNYPVVYKKKIIKRTKIKTNKDSASFVPTAKNTGPEETVTNVEEQFNHSVVDKRKKLQCIKIKTNKGSAPSVSTAMKTGPIKPRPRRKYCFEAESSSDSSDTQNKRTRKKEDTDYCPDSTSHSEDSVYDSFDDEGKRIPRPKDNRVYPMKCDHCDYDIPKRAEHYRHYLYEHPNIEYPYLRERTACSICGKLYPMATIRLHELKHTKMEVKCTECPRVFNNPSTMAKHRWKCHRSKSFTCDYCSKTFNQRHDLIRHLRIHTGEKPFKCHICDAVFAHSGNRSHHIRSTHQNINIAPKIRKGNKKIRKHKKKHYTDTVLESRENEIGQTRRKKTKLRKRRKNKEHLSKIKTLVINRKMHKVQKNNDNRIEPIDNNDRQTKKRKKNKKKVCRTNKGDKVRSKDSEEFDTDSDDETLADKKAKKTILDLEVFI